MGEAIAAGHQVHGPRPGADFPGGIGIKKPGYHVEPLGTGHLGDVDGYVDAGCGNLPCAQPFQQDAVIAPEFDDAFRP